MTTRRDEAAGVDWPDLIVSVVRTGLLLVVVVMADPSLRFEAMIRAERILRWWNRRREGSTTLPLPPPAPAVTAVLERARQIVRGSSVEEGA